MYKYYIIIILLYIIINIRYTKMLRIYLNITSRPLCPDDRSQTKSMDD